MNSEIQVSLPTRDRRDERLIFTFSLTVEQSVVLEHYCGTHCWTAELEEAVLVPAGPPQKKRRNELSSFLADGIEMKNMP